MRKVQRKAWGLVSVARICGAAFASLGCPSSGARSAALTTNGCAFAGFSGRCGTETGAIFPDEIWQHESSQAAALVICASPQCAIMGQSGGHFVPVPSEEAEGQQALKASAGAASIASTTTRATILEAPSMRIEPIVIESITPIL